MKAIEELSNLKREGLQIFPEDVILLLLYSHSDKPVINRTVLMKEVFLTYEEVLKEKEMKFINPEFFAYKFGPFSYRVSEALWFLSSGGLIQVQGRAKGKKEEFRITKNGVAVVKLLMKKMSRNVNKMLIEDLANKRKGWDQFGRNGILNYVYKMYQDYSVRSKIKQKYGTTIWGELFKE